MNEFVTKNSKSLIAAACIIGGYGVYTMSHSTPSVPLTALAQQPAAVAPATSAPSAATETLSFRVMSVGASTKTGAKFLNSKVSYREAGNQSVILSGAAAGVDEKTLIGRTVTVTGTSKPNQQGGKNVSTSDPSRVSFSQ